MRHSLSRLLSVSIAIAILLLFAISSVTLAQQTGGQDIRARDLTISESLYNYAFHRQIYGGNNDAFRINYLGTGGLLFDFQADNASVFLCTKAGNANLLGPLTTYMLGLKDTDRSHALVMKWNENDTADRVLNFLVNGANRTIDLSNDLIVTALTNTRLLATDGVGDIVSSDLFGWVTGTANRVTIADDGDGTITFTTPQDSDVTASPTYVGMTLTGLTGTRLVATTGADALTSSDLFAWVAGTTNQVNVANDGDGTITLSTPQDIHTGASPTFANQIITTNLSVGYQDTSETIAGIPFDIKMYVGIEGNTDLGDVWFDRHTNTNIFSPNLILARTRGITHAGATVVADNDYLGRLLFVGFDGTDYGLSSQIHAEVDDPTPAATDMGGALVFSTALAGTEALVEQMRIDNTGQVHLTIDLDISDDTNLAVTVPVVLTDDTLSITISDEFIYANQFKPQGDGADNNIVPTIRADATNNRMFNRSEANGDTQDMDWYTEYELPEFSSGITTLKIYTRASDFANCVMTMTLEDQAGNADATGPVTITPTGNDTWEEFTYTPTSAYTGLEHTWMKIAITSLDTGDTADFGGVAADL